MTTSNTIKSSSIKMSWSFTPWDEVVCGFPVIQIEKIEVIGPTADIDIIEFEKLRDLAKVGLVSCRLPHYQLTESILLEDHGFRFVEMVYTPEITLTPEIIDTDIDLLSVKRACDDDLPAVLEIARTAFDNERFKMDPRLDPAISDQRFQNWVASTKNHSTQELYVITDGSRIISFFVTELLSDLTCYWHLNAVAPDAQGIGYGRRVWLTMMRHAAKSGAQRVRSSIAVRNHRVLNLYARLGFKFLPPTMTLHWVRASFQRKSYV